MQQFTDSRVAIQTALNTIDNLEACNKFNPTALTQWGEARAALIEAEDCIIACMIAQTAG